jgi:hypothetical protein
LKHNFGGFKNKFCEVLNRVFWAKKKFHLGFEIRLFGGIKQGVLVVWNRGFQSLKQGVLGLE